MISVETKDLKDALNVLKPIKGNDLLEITKYYQLTAKEGKFIIEGTDGKNYVKATLNSDGADEFTTIINSNSFVKLINKTTVDTVSFLMTRDYLKVNGNGVYKFEIVTDEIYPTIEVDSDKVIPVNGLILSKALEGGKNCKSNEAVDGSLFGYYIDNDSLFATDSFKIYKSEGIGNTGTKLLLNPVMGDLLINLKEEEISFNINTQYNILTVLGKSIKIVGKLMEEVEEYPDVNSLFNLSFLSKIEVSKSEVLQAIDRVTIFLTALDKDRVNLELSNNKLIITAKGSKENIPFCLSYSKGDNDGFSIKLNYKYLVNILKACSNDLLYIKWGEQEGMLRIDDKEVSTIIGGIIDE